MEANDPIQITLTAQQWNVVIAALNEAPYRVAAPVIEAVLAQANPKTGEILPPHRPGNGHDTTSAEPA